MGAMLHRRSAVGGPREAEIVRLNQLARAAESAAVVADIIEAGAENVTNKRGYFLND